MNRSGPTMAAGQTLLRRAYASQVVLARRAIGLDYSYGANYHWPPKK